MKKISVEEAIEFAQYNYPNGPESLAELLEVEVRRSVIQGDGYCIPGTARPVIRLNSAVSPRRQRFTLAHELGHIVLNVTSIAGRRVRESSRNISEEEKQVNKFAGEILLPAGVAQSAIQRLPISRKVIENLAESANVSRVFVVRRLTDLAPRLGLVGAATFHYERQIYRWCSPAGASGLVPKKEALLRRCLKEESGSWRTIRNQHIFYSHLFPNPNFDAQTIWMQILRADEDTYEAWEAILTRLETMLLLNRQHLRPSLAGCMGSMKLKIANFTTQEAVELFNARYLNSEGRWDAEFRARLLSDDGQKYLAMRLDEWTLRDED